MFDDFIFYCLKQENYQVYKNVMIYTNVKGIQLLSFPDETIIKRNTENQS